MKHLFLIALAFTVFSSCKKDFIVEDIKGKTITMVSPQDSLTTTSNIITFWWEPVEGVENYHLQIVSPSFTNVILDIADTLTKETKLKINLNPGNYSWRLRGENSGGNTSYQSGFFKVDSSSILTDQKVIIIAPGDQFQTNQSLMNFSWNPLNFASSYSIELTVGSTVVHYTTTSLTNYAYTFSNLPKLEQECSWRIRAFNDNSISKYSSAFTFTIDKQAPTASLPSSPSALSLVTDSTHLKWTRQSGTYSDSIYLFSDANQNILVGKTLILDSKVQVAALSSSITLSAGTGTANATTYYWQLKSNDKAGNFSALSSASSFKLYK